jgi:predicted amidophosphoribosyltransferase
VPVGCLDGIPLVAAGRLAGAWQRAIHTYKYRKRPQLAAPLAGPLQQAVLAASLGLSGLTFIPLSSARQRERGFNQAERLGHSLAQRLGLPLHSGLARGRDTAAQVGLDEAERRRNVAGAFRWVAPGPPPSGLGLIDDVCTTGATLRAAAAAVEDAGGRLAAFLVLAVAPAQTLPGRLVTSGRVLGDSPVQGEIS